jgi:hypothetical protein
VAAVSMSNGSNLYDRSRSAGRFNLDRVDGAGTRSADARLVAGRLREQPEPASGSIHGSAILGWARSTARRAFGDLELLWGPIEGRQDHQLLLPELFTGGSLIVARAA